MDELKTKKERKKRQICLKNEKENRKLKKLKERMWNFLMKKSNFVDLFKCVALCK